MRKKIRRVESSTRSLNVRKRINRYNGDLRTLKRILLIDANESDDVDADCIDSQAPTNLSSLDLLEKA